MANSAVKWNVVVNQNGGGSICARVRGPDAALITQAAISSISARYKPSRSSGAVTATALTVASVVFDTLQTDAYWNDIDGVAADTLGYNFRWTFGASVFTEATQYNVTFMFTPASGAAFPLNVMVDVRPQLA